MFADFKKAIVDELLQDPNYIDEITEKVAEAVGVKKDTALEIINEWIEEAASEENWERTLQEEKLEEGTKLKAAIMAGILAIGGIVGAHASSYKSAADFGKSSKEVKKELIAEYGKNGDIGEKDLKQMISACQEYMEDEGYFDTGNPLIKFSAAQKASNAKANVANILHKAGFKNAADSIEGLDVEKEAEFEEFWEKYNLDKYFE